MPSLLSLAARRPALTLATAFLVTVAAITCTALKLRLDTDPARMLDPNLPYLEAQRRHLAAFPMFDRLLVALVEAPGASLAEDAAIALAARLNASKGSFRGIYHAGQDPHFKRNGLLYLEEAALWDMDKRLAAAAPFLGAVAADPSLRGLVSMLESGLDNPLDAGQATELARLYDRVRTSADEELAGRSPRVAWRDELFPREAGSDGLFREYVLIQPLVDFGRLDPAGAPLSQARKAGSHIEHDFPQVQVRFTGPVALDEEELAAVAASAGLTTTLSLVLVLGVLIWGLRSLGLVAAVLVNLLVGLALTTAFATLTVGSLNLITVNFAVLFIGMGVDFGIQYAARYRELEGLRRLERLTQTSLGVSGALWLAALAAAVSFLAFTPTDYRGLAELGLISAAGMFIAFASTLTLLPALLRLLPSTRHRVAQRQAAAHANLGAPVGKPQQDRIDPRARWSLSILLGAAALTAGSLFLLPQVSFDFNPLNLKDPQAPSVRAYRALLADPRATPYTAQVLVADAEAAQAMAEGLRALPLVEKVVWVASWVPPAQEERLAIIEGMRLALDPVLMATPREAPKSAETQQLLARFAERLQAEHAGLEHPTLARAARRLGVSLSRLATVTASDSKRLKSFEAGLIGDLEKALTRLRELLGAGPVAVDSLPEELARRYVAEDGTHRLEVYPRENLSDNRALAAFVHAVRALAPDAAGAPVGIYSGGEVVIEATLKATLLAVVASFLLFLLWLRNVGDTLLVMLPLLLGLIAMGGSSVALGLPFNLANIIALPLLIGLNNAYGAYLILRARELGAPALLASGTPRAVLLSGLTTAGSFTTLALASHPGMAGMGIFVGLAIVWSLLFALVVLPALLLWLEG